MTPASEPSATAAARRALMLARQARVGILRNPNSPPRPPLRRASLMGKWHNLQSRRRPQSQTLGDTGIVAAPATTDTELARMMKENLAPSGPADGTVAAGTEATDHPAAPGALMPGTPMKVQLRRVGHRQKLLIVIAFLTALTALALLATAS